MSSRGKSRKVPRPQKFWGFWGNVVFLLGVFMLWPEEAYAWGPALHTFLALETLLKVATLSPALKKLLQRYPNDFIYGNLSADIILGKKYIDYYYHCHNWRVGMEVLDSARTDAQKSFAYGYLCHLAADVIAHNIFVPDKVVRNYQTFTARHAYWEVRYDLRFDRQLIHRAHRIAENYHSKNDILLEEILRETIFSFKTNKKIFNGLLRIQKQERVQRFLKRIAERSPLEMAEPRAKRYEELSRNAIADILKNMSHSEFLKADPAGHRKIDIAKDLRKKIKKLAGEGQIHPKEIEKVIKTFHDNLNETLYLPNQCPNAEQIIISIS